MPHRVDWHERGDFFNSINYACALTLAHESRHTDCGTLVLRCLMYDAAAFCEISHTYTTAHFFSTKRT